MSDKQEFKVISSVSDRHGKHAYWARVGSAFRNKDSSVNVYLDVMPKSFQLQIRELTADDYRRRDEARAAKAAFGPGGSGGPGGSDGSRPGMGAFERPAPLGRPPSNPEPGPF